MSPQVPRHRAAPPLFRRHRIAGAASLVVLGVSALPLSAQVLPVGPTVINGTATVSTVGTRMQVTNTPDAVINWQAFSIGALNAVNFAQQSAASRVLNRVVGNDLSNIAGSLTSNGFVFLVNPNGVVFGPGAVVNVAGFAASSLAISDDALRTGRFILNSTGSGAGIVNRGQITAGPGGIVWLVGETVRNEGLITAPAASIVLAAGQRVEIVTTTAPNVGLRVAVEGIIATAGNEVVNLGSLVSQGGTIDVFGGIVNQQGIVRADTVLDGIGGLSDAGRVSLVASTAVDVAAGSSTRAGAGNLAISAPDVRIAGSVDATAPAPAAPGELTIIGDTVTLAPGASVTGDHRTTVRGRVVDAAGTLASSAPNAGERLPAVLIQAEESFLNNGLGLTASNGRWLVESVTPDANRGEFDLDFAFAQFGVAPGAATSLNGNGLLYSDARTISLPVNASRTYDSTTAASFSSLVAPVSDGRLRVQDSDVAGSVPATFANSNVGTAKVLQPQAEGAEALFEVQAVGPGGTLRPVFGTSFAYTADISPATLTFVADPAQRFTGAPVTGLTGSVTGFVGADTLASQTSGVAQWTTPANAQSPAGRYAIQGSGLTSGNYVFVQSASNATALTLNAASTPGTANPPGTASPPNTAAPEATSRIAAEGAQNDITNALVLARAMISVPTGGSILDASGGTGNDLFGPLRVADKSEAELLRLLESRRQFKRKLFADAIYKLELDPALADVPTCATVEESASGNCRYSAEQVAEVQKQRVAQAAASLPAARPAPKGALPQINRKIALFFGVSQYTDTKIPAVDTALPDVDSVSAIVAERMGYETRVVRNPTKQEIVAALNKLAGELGPDDSLLIYYSGHGYTLERNGAGYWLPSDAPVDDPKRWISNDDVARLLAAVPSKQVALVTDSCYSAAFTREGRAGVGGGASAEELLTKRSVVVLASGGDEPVSDEGKDGRSVFAWNLMNTLRAVESWRPGTNVFTEIQQGVRKELPQTPRYGTVSAAGHEPGGDYLFEQR